jgi:NADH-quinone oxidoreductase subunit L
MFLAMGVGAYAAGIFHLFTHAFFKALLFLGSGAVIHALAGEQDLRKMGGLRSTLPKTYWTFLIGAIAIAGVPGFAGFFSKDEILFRTYTAGRTWLWLIGIVTAFLTATYMFRLVFLAFHGPRAAEHTERDAGAAHATPDAHAHEHGAHLHDAPPSMAAALMVLALGSIVAGYWGLPHVLGGSNRVETFLAPSFHAQGPEAETTEATAEEPASGGEGLELTLMTVSVAVAVAGIGLAAFLFLRRRDLADALASRFSGVHRVLLNKYYVDEIYDAVIVQPIKRFSTTALWRGMDAGFIDGAVNGVGTAVRQMSDVLRRVQTGSVRSYAVSFVIGVIVVLGYYLLL